jgi:hypothetical protein
MKFKRILASIAGVVGLFFVFFFPVGRMVFSHTGENIVDRITLWLGIFSNAEPGDSLAWTVLLISLLLAISAVWLANLFINRCNRKHSNFK